jgi:hypothetical protein
MRVPLSIGVVAAVGCGDGYLDREVQVVYTPETAAAELSLTGPIVTERFPETVGASTHNDAQVFVLDLTERAPSFRQLVGTSAVYDPASLTVSAPFAAMPCGERRFAFVILDGVRDTSEAPIGRSRAFHEDFEEGSTFGALRAALASIGIELANVAGASLFPSSAPCP